MIISNSFIDLALAYICERCWCKKIESFQVESMRCIYFRFDAVGACRFKALNFTIYFSQVRMNLVSCWLPVLNVCRDIVFPMPTGQKSIIQDLEEAFLRIISTLPLSDSQELLQQCLSFSTRNIDDCPHLILAFKTWFRRANRTATKE